MDVKLITPVLITYNEADNIGRTLSKLRWAERIIIIDSGSTDDTLALIKEFPQVETFHRDFDSMANQWNYGLSQVKTPWILSLDADYSLTDHLYAELSDLEPGKHQAFAIPFRYCVFGKPLVGSLLPPRVALFMKSAASYFDDGHTQKLCCKGPIGNIKSPLIHDDRKPLSRWLNNQILYIDLEAKKLAAHQQETLPLADKIRKTKWLAPFLVFFYALFIKGAILSGWRGVFYAYQRMFVESLLAIRLIETENSADRLKNA